MEPYSFLISLAISLVVSAVSYMITPRASGVKSPEPATLEQLDVPTAEDGKEIGVLFGTRWVNSPNVIWYGDLYCEPVKEGSGGGK